ncbi:mannose-1-phosphate guanylyltransferase, partial [Uliginosibacterium sp. sgz301328]|uniref:mannose-1-phosphate guanylyltransferase n=1 Tax=Uliginosibacterium sp. sgz301328 TaxID=3243764 RepID=UPI00359DCE63
IAEQDGDDPVLLVMPADQVVVDVAAFQRAMHEGYVLAQGGALVTFGIVPDRAETGYGYIRTGTPVAGAATARALSAFVEKPNAERAEQYVASGHYLWNSGIFMMRASVWRRALVTFAPAISKACEEAVAAAKRDVDFVRVDKAIFAACPSDSIDYAVMEKLNEHPELGQGIVVPLAVGWSDVGAWDALWQVGDKDDAGNVTRGEVMLEDTRDSLI